MEEENKRNNQNISQCKECGLHYKDKGLSEKCEAWCKEHKTCNVEITSQSEENPPQPVPSRNGVGASQKEDELQGLEKRAEEYLNNWKRERADFLNYKKDEAERMVNLIRYEKEDIILNILPILDNIYLAERQLPENLKKPSFAKATDGQRGEKGSQQAIEWTKGFLQIQKQLEDFLKKQGIEEIITVGQKFNPETMEAVGEANGEEQMTSGAVAEELQKGYTMNGKVIRPSKVKISK